MSIGRLLKPVLIQLRWRAITVYALNLIAILNLVVWARGQLGPMELSTFLSRLWHLLMDGHYEIVFFAAWFSSPIWVLAIAAVLVLRRRPKPPTGSGIF